MRDESAGGAKLIAEAGETAAAEPELAIPVEIVDPAVLRSPLVLSSPHSGRV